MLTDQKKILTEIKHFYADLFKNNDSELSIQKLQDISHLKGANHLSDKETLSLEGTLKLEEISIALKSMKNQKCPGIDGLSFSKFSGENSNISS